MQSGRTFKAPWSRSLKFITALSACILVGMPLAGVIYTPPREVAVIWIIGMIILPMTIFVGAAFFMIRGYRLTPHKLLVQRLGWHSELDLDDLQSVEADPEAMKGSIRLLGNGGLFCFAGKFRNQKLGAYRAFATEPKLSVVLRFSDRTVVVTPEQPAAFVTVVTSNMALRRRQARPMDD